MAKETIAERKVREAREHEEYLAEQASTYLQRLMSTMERACRANFDLDIRDNVFVLYDRDDRAYDKYELHVVFDQETDEMLNRFESEVSWKEKRIAEENRKYLVKQSALAKLSDEERELLGL